MTPELMKKQMTEAEWQKVYDMSKDKNLYHNLCSSLFPTIHGKLHGVDFSCQQISLLNTCMKQLEETIGTSLYNVVEDYSTGPEIQEPLLE